MHAYNVRYVKKLLYPVLYFTVHLRLNMHLFISNIYKNSKNLLGYVWSLLIRLVVNSYRTILLIFNIYKYQDLPATEINNLHDLNSI